MYVTPDGEPDRKALVTRDDGCYCEFDTYMLLSDYNHLREMLGYGKISLGEDEYAVHIKKRVLGEMGDFPGQLKGGRAFVLRILYRAILPGRA